MSKCIKCGSHAFNLYKDGIDQGGLCDVHYWQGRAHRAEALAEQPAQQEPVALNRDGMKKLLAQSGYDTACPAEKAAFLSGVRHREAESLDATPSPQPAQQEPVAFLANGTRFKISYDSRQSGGQIHGIPPELGGRWVAFVAADDDCHLKLTSPPASKPLTDEPTKEMLDAAERIDWSDADVRGNIVNMWQAMCAAAPQRKPLPQTPPAYANINQRIAYKAGWRDAETAHGIKEQP